jgi:hypothetical protein
MTKFIQKGGQQDWQRGNIKLVLPSSREIISMRKKRKEE